MFQNFAFEINILGDLDTVNLGNGLKDSGDTQHLGSSARFDHLKGIVIAFCLGLSLVPFNFVAQSEHGQIIDLGWMEK